MKNNFQTNPAIFKIIVLITCFMLVIIYNKSKAANLINPPSTYKKVAVVFTQNVANKELKVLIKAAANKVIQLYFFSKEGKMVKKISLNTSKEIIIKDMQKGMYLYECYDNELKLNNGKLIIK